MKFAIVIACLFLLVTYYTPIQETKTAKPHQVKRITFSLSINDTIPVPERSKSFCYGCIELTKKQQYNQDNYGFHH